MSFTNLNNIGTRHLDAVRGLNFYKEELHILESRLFEVASKNTSFEARQGMEHFQSQFVIQQKNVHDLRHKLEKMETALASESLAHAGRVDDHHVPEEKDLMGDYFRLERIIKELRREFNLYLQKWM